MPDWLDEYERLAAAATPAPWCVYLRELWTGTADTLAEYDRLAPDMVDITDLDQHSLFHGDVVHPPDAELIAWLRVHGDELVSAARQYERLTRDRFDPDWTIAPGDILREELQARGISLTELAQMLSRGRPAISKIINAHQPLTPDIALKLEATLGISAEFWTRLEAQYRLDLAKGKKRMLADA